MNKKISGLILAMLLGTVGAGFATQASALTISLGWHGDRYYDGHRYWSRDEWTHNHPSHHGAPHHGDDHHDDGHHG
jgi:hypothetical protein